MAKAPLARLVYVPCLLNLRVVRVQEKLPNKGLIRFHHITDLHVGAPDFDEKSFLARRKLIEQDPQARWMMGGDGGDLIRHNDPRYEISSLSKRYRTATDVRAATREHLGELFAPIVDKCWAWADGNHENKMNKFYGGNFGVEVCCDLELEDKFVGYRGFVGVSVTVGKNHRLPLVFDIQHGWQTGRLKGGFLVQAERELGMTDADVVLRGHNHQPAAHSFITLGLAGGGSGNKIVQRTRTVVNGGSWRTGYRDDLKNIDRNKLSEVEGDLWGETKGYRAEKVGGPVILFRFNQGSGSPGKSHFPAGISHTIIEGEITERTLGIN